MYVNSKKQLSSMCLHIYTTINVAIILYNYIPTLLNSNVGNILESTIPGLAEALKSHFKVSYFYDCATVIEFLGEMLVSGTHITSS